MWKLKPLKKRLTRNQQIARSARISWRKVFSRERQRIWKSIDRKLMLIIMNRLGFSARSIYRLLLIHKN